MRIDFQTHGFKLTDALRDYTETRLRFVLTASHSHIQRISVRLSDINGPRGGTDKLCHIKVVLTTLPDIIIKDVEPDMYAAINRAADRAGRNVLRKIHRKQTIGRKAQPLQVNA